MPRFPIFPSKRKRKPFHLIQNKEKKLVISPVITKRWRSLLWSFNFPIFQNKKFSFLSHLLICLSPVYFSFSFRFVPSSFPIPLNLSLSLCPPQGKPWASNQIKGNAPPPFFCFLFLWLVCIVQRDGEIVIRRRRCVFVAARGHQNNTNSNNSSNNNLWVLSHESEHDLALMVNDFLENNCRSAGTDSWRSSDSESGFSDLIHSFLSFLFFWVEEFWCFFSWFALIEHFWIT